ncbi:TPA: hypothetical protein ACXNHB_000302 [Providencia stuartii]|nr:hypothetical protein [Providencia stuartii]
MRCRGLYLAVTPNSLLGLRSRGCLCVSGADLSISTKLAIGQSVPLYALYGLFLRSAIHASRRFKFHRCLEFMLDFMLPPVYSP